MPSDEARARTICDHGTYNLMLSQLYKEGLYESQRNRIADIYKNELQPAHPFSSYEWEMFTVLELYDTMTLHHSLRVFSLIAEKMESNRPLGYFLRSYLSKESISKDDVYRAALFHDIGKTSLPKEILHDETSDTDWLLLAKVFLSARQYEAACDLLQKHSKLRAKDIIPFSYTLTKESVEKFQRMGIDPYQPLGSLLAEHAGISGEILRSYHFSTSAEIAENHHNTPLHKHLRKPRISSFRASSILRVADIFDAILHRRSYKRASTHIRALEEIETEATVHGFIESKLAHLWIADELSLKA